MKAEDLVFFSEILTPSLTYSEHIKFTVSKKYALRERSVSLSSFPEQWLCFIIELNRKIVATEHKSIHPV